MTLISGLIVGFFLFAPWASGGTVETCAPFQAVTVGSYIVQTDYWNKGQCPGTQCVSIDDQTGSYTVTKDDFKCAKDFTVGSYPSILYGKAFGATSPNCDLPAPLSDLKCVNSSWSFQPTDTGGWDAAYDIWLCPDHSCGPEGFKGGAEVMIWLDYRNANGWQYDMGPATISGMNWEVWRWDPKDSGSGSDYVAYLAKTPTTSIRNLDIKGFLDDSQARGYIKPSWYLYAVEVGNEFHSGGVPFTSKSFSVSVNKDCGAKPVFTPMPWTPTPTPDLTPVVIPPPP
jgi:hypothetical protein